ncbi:hypothetical protein HFO74_13955 [Rhizobium laguerreae]|uniref:Uncharacterized protein n=1 Tax=Rhizobium laguerreae TaxID=1076926 RepID=A0AB35FCU2_9HYPH|nr:hypothetical protein [Rhizobium laguerreae]MBY3064527.1 hypothetical protein [Rhizobium laguerreae]
MRILGKKVRTYVERPKFEQVISFYEKLHNTSSELRFDIHEGCINVAIVGDIMIFSGTAEALAEIRHIQATFLVDALDDFLLLLIARGGEVLRVTYNDRLGRHLWMRNPDDLVVDYLESGIW